MRICNARFQCRFGDAQRFFRVNSAAWTCAKSGLTRRMNTEDQCVRGLGYPSWEVYKRRRPSEMKMGSNRFRHVGLMNKEEIVRVDYGSPQMVAALSLRKEVFV